MTKIRLTRYTDPIGNKFYKYETSTHRYVTSRDGDWWVTKIFKLERVGTMEPPLMIGGAFVGNLMNLTLGEARTEIAEDAGKRA